MCSTWLLAVLGAINSSLAISALVRPSVMSLALARDCAPRDAEAPTLGLLRDRVQQPGLADP
jgi:hypothetical protein